MNKFVGKICPYCKGTFTEEDEVVVCSECEMPHHKDCWISNKGCTTFGCTGTIQGIDFEPDLGISSAPKYEQRNDGVTANSNSTTPAFCSNCGAQLLPGSGFCAKCGAKVMVAQAPVNNYVQTISNVTAKVSSELKNVMQEYKTSEELDPEMAKYIGSKADYYMPQFGQLKMSKKYSSWNWFAFLISPFWCMYRKMYVQGGVILGISFLLSIIGGVFSQFISWGMWAVVGVFANYFYMYDLEKRIEKGRTLPEPQKSQYIEKYGDVNATIPAVAAVIYVLVCVILFV